MESAIREEGYVQGKKKGYLNSDLKVVQELATWMIGSKLILGRRNHESKRPCSDGFVLVFSEHWASAV